MAIGTSFKQQCPSCEALVPVKDVGMVGKKIECPKCKDKFIVKSPAKKSTDEEDEEDAPKTKANGKKVPAKMPAKRVADEDEDDAEEEEPKKGPVKAKKKAKEEDDEEDEGAGKKKKAGSSRFALGIALAVVGLLVLSAAAYFILFSKSTADKKPPSKTPPNTAIAKVPKGGNPPVTDPNTKDKKEPSKETGTKPRSVEVPLSAANAELTNLLPNDTQHVAHVPMRFLLGPASPLLDAMFQTPGALDDKFLRGKLGFSVLKIDDLIRAERYGAGGWSFTVVHLGEIIDQEGVKQALDLKPAVMVKNHTHYQAATANPWFEQLARFAIGVPRLARALPGQQNRPLFVHFHNPQTLILADEAPMVAFLKEDKRFKSVADDPTPGSNKPSKKPKAPPPPPVPDANPPTGAPDDASNAPPPARLETYMTIRPSLKTILDRMESFGTDSKEKVVFSSATDLEAAALPGAVSEDKGKLLWYPRQIWDVTLLLQDRNPRLRTLGVAVVQKDDKTFQVRNELQCPLDNDAKNLQIELADDIAPSVARFIDRFLAHRVEVPKKEEPIDPLRPPPPVRPIDPKEKKDEPTVSRILVTQKEKTVDFILDLKLDQPELGKLHGIASLLSCGLRAGMEAAPGNTTTLHALARAGKLLSEKGLSDRNVLPGQYPPGAFPRPASTSKRYTREPMQRVSWMAGLLPFLGHDSLYGKINFNDSWRDPSNWIPASTLVPQFLDPMYPRSSHFLTRPDLPFELAATHFVGIAGVGLDAADYDPTDPATITKRGVMSYDKGMSLEEIRKGHGLANTMLMVQVPPDSIAGVTPWMAGGGSTLRGVPDVNSVAPFVFSSTGNDKKTRRGTYAIMADGSVRFIDQNVSDEVFKALATAISPLPENYEPNSTDSKTPLIKASKGF